MCMRYIDNTAEVKSTSLSKTWMSAFLLGDGLHARVSNARRSFLVLMNVRGKAQETLTREKRHCESRRKPMFPHFFRRANCGLRTRSPGTCITSDSQEGLWITCLRSRRGGESSREVECRRSMSISGTKWSSTHPDLIGTRPGLFDRSCFRMSSWAWREGTFRTSSDPVIFPPDTAGSTSAGALATTKVTAKTARVSHQPGPHAATRTFLGSEALRAESYGKVRRCL
jgi:hypothetical protein